MFKSLLISAAFLSFGAVGTADVVPTLDEGEPCTLTAEFSNGDVSGTITVTAPTCAEAASTLGVIADAIDNQ